MLVCVCVCEREREGERERERERICAYLYISLLWWMAENLYLLSGIKITSICFFDKLKECSSYLINMLEDDAFSGFVLLFLVSYTCTWWVLNPGLCTPPRSYVGKVPFELELIDFYGLMFVAKYYSSYFLCMLYMNWKENFTAALLLSLIPDFWHY